MIAFNQNDSVSYGQDGQWYNAGQQGSIQNIRSDTTNQLSIVNVDGTVTINALTGTTQDKLVIVGASDVIAQSILPVVSIAKGGTNSSTALANSKIMGSVAGAIVEISSIPSGVSANSAQVLNPTNQAQETLQKTLQDVLDASGGTGTVTNVSSVNADIGVANPTTTPVLTLNSGTGNNQIVKLTADAKLPAVDSGSNTLVIDPTDSVSRALNTALSNIYNTSGGTVSSVASANDGLTVANPNTNVIINDVVDNDRGLAIDTLGKYIKVDGTTVDFNGSGELMSIGTGSGTVTNVSSANEGIAITNPTTTPVITDVCDETKGLIVGADGKQVKIDNNTIKFNGQGQIYATGNSARFTINPTQIKGNNNVASSVYINPTLPSNPYQGVPCSNISNAGSFNYITDTNIDNVTGSSVVNATIKIMCFAGTDLIAPQSIDIALSLTALADDFADYLPINTNVNTLNLSPNENKFYTATITGTSPSSTGIFALNFAFSGIQGTGQILLIGSANLNIVIS